MESNVRAIAALLQNIEQNSYAEWTRPFVDWLQDGKDWVKDGEQLLGMKNDVDA